MFHYDPITELQLVHLQQAEDRRRAEIARWVHEARSTHPTYTDRVLSMVGTMLVQLGLRLCSDRTESIVSSLPNGTTVGAGRRMPPSTAAVLGYPLYVVPRREVRK
jgi:hypothetical protein